MVARLYIYKSLDNDGGFWVFTRVMDGDEEKGTADILIGFSDWALWTV